MVQWSCAKDRSKHGNVQSSSYSREAHHKVQNFTRDAAEPHEGSVLVIESNQQAVAGNILHKTVYLRGTWLLSEHSTEVLLPMRPMLSYCLAGSLCAVQDDMPYNGDRAIPYA